MLALQTGCESHLSVTEKQRIARAYADALFLEAKYPNDSIRQRYVVDSAVTIYGFKNWQDLKAVVDQSTQEPDDFRMILDSAQRILERRQKITTKQTYRQPKDTSDKTATPAR